MPESEDFRRRFRPSWLAAIGIFALTAVVFAPAIRCDFVNYDDDVYVYANANVNRGLTLSGIARAFTQPHARNWHPLTTLSHMLDCQFFGLNPAAHHGVNVLMHALAASTLFLALRTMSGKAGRAFVVAALFAVHPLRVESVAWVAERKDVLSALLFALTLAAYADFARTSEWRRMWKVILLFAAGLMAKPMLVTTPLILLLLDYWPLQRIGARAARQSGFAPVPLRRAIIEKIPLFALSVLSCLATIVAAQRGDNALSAIPLPDRLANAALSYCIYIYQLFWPAKLAVFCPWPSVPPPLAWILSAAIFILAITIAAALLRRRFGYFFVGWFWYLIMLVPVSGILQIGLQAQADRYTYLAQIGLLIALTWGVADLLRQISIPSIAVPAASLLIALFAWRSWTDLRWWRSSESLWTHALAVTKDNDVALNNLGAIYESRGELQLALEKYHEAERILDHRPAQPYALSRALLHNNIGNLFLRRGEISTAMDEYRQSIALRPAFANAYVNLGQAYVELGDWNSALAEYESAARLQPHDADAQHRAGMALVRLGRVGEAIAYYRAALKVDPQFATAELDLGNALLEQKQIDEAMSHYRRATQIDPENPNAHFNLASVFLQQHRLTDAIKEYERVVELQPRDSQAHLSLGNALATASSGKRALVEIEKALELAPDSVSAMNNLAWLLAASPDPNVRDPAAAIALAEKAVELAPQPNALIYHTLAAAYAASQRKDEAISAAERCRQLAIEQGDTALAEAVEHELTAYRGSPAR
jgi:tetratricopeptide (TPR) repeat protein